MYKLGDKLKIVDTSAHGFKMGEIVTVVSEDEGFFSAINTEGKTQLLIDNNVEPAPKLDTFEVGEEVRVIANSIHRYPIGSIAKITTIDKRRDTKYPIRATDGRSSFGVWMELNDIEKIKMEDKEMKNEIAVGKKVMVTEPLHGVDRPFVGKTFTVEKQDVGDGGFWFLEGVKDLYGNEIAMHVTQLKVVEEEKKEEVKDMALEIGDKVLVLEKSREIMEGNWSSKMSEVIGKVGEVVRKSGYDSTVIVAFENGDTWYYEPSALKKVTSIKPLEITEEAPKPFKKGDIVKGISPVSRPYSITSVQMSEGEVVRVFTEHGVDFIEVKVLKHEDPRNVNDTYEVRPEYFELVDKSSMEQTIEEGDIITGKKGAGAYAFTNEDMTEGLVTLVKGNKIVVKILKHKVPARVGISFDVSAEYFDIVRKHNAPKKYPKIEIKNGVKTVWNPPYTIAEVVVDGRKINAKSKCMKTDIFDEITGKSYAMERLVEKLADYINY